MEDRPFNTELIVDTLGQLVNRDTQRRITIQTGQAGMDAFRQAMAQDIGYIPMNYTSQEQINTLRRDQMSPEDAQIWAELQLERETQLMWGQGQLTDMPLYNMSEINGYSDAAMAFAMSLGALKEYPRDTTHITKDTNLDELINILLHD